LRQPAWKQYGCYRFGTGEKLLTSKLKDMEDKILWCIEQHRKTNHFYDTYLPYEFHLRMVIQVCHDFKQLSPSLYVSELACWGHDLIEDCRVSYNDCKEHLGADAANIIYAVSNEKGKNRKERANEKYYEGIRNTEGATFVKLCDRIANVQYSKLTKSKMFEMYKKENQQFVQLLYTDKHITMFDYLDSLFIN
jgi:(p)ppGpp synthase/HD superfamily hydrolase